MSEHSIRIAADRLSDAMRHGNDIDALREENERLRGALELLKLAVDREGWPAGWGIIRARVHKALHLDEQIGQSDGKN